MGIQFVGSERGFTLKRFIPVFGVVVVLACLTAGGASALTFQDQTCDNSKPTCPLPAGSAEVPYQFDMFARSGCQPYHYNITGGTPVPGLTLSTVNDKASGGIGRLAGTPTTPGNYSFWVTISSPESPTCLGDRADRLFTITIGQAPLLIKTQSLRRGVTGEAYSENLAASGPGNKQWSASGLPAGLAVSGNTITGTPTTAGDYTVTLTVTNGGETKSSQYQLKIIDGLKVSSTAFKGAELGRRFSTTIQASGGSGSFSWTVGTLPAGLSFDGNSHVLSGTPTTPGTYVVHFSVSDGTFGLTKGLDLSLKVAPHVAFAGRGLRGAVSGKRYAAKLRAFGGVTPFTFRALGKLPAGLKLNARTGALSGAPRAAGTFTFNVRIKDALGASATQSFTLRVK